MRSSLPARERALWIGVVAVLAIAVSWMAVLEIAWVTHALAARPAWVAVARAIGHVVWSAANARSLGAAHV